MTVETKLTDFRTATITQHWNDPPQKIFFKPDDGYDRLDSYQIRSILEKILENCKNHSMVSDRRMVTDSEKRLALLFERLEKEQISESVLGRLCKMCEYVKENDFINALTIHSNLMTTDFGNEGKWLLGLKRLLDLCKKKLESK
ncbi:3916_t:CDS:2 [Diversispora eburnea]|uniref:3916_t:CDS:1 n=1 Tax=Diversispora eburnea TaxID=1213867 RepID=A0A9N9AV08_9GLOM|nr:3916_t:CDS:2 [Diversispora eburnea]